MGFPNVVEYDLAWTAAYPNSHKGARLQSAETSHGGELSDLREQDA